MLFYNYDDLLMFYLYFSLQSISIKPCAIAAHHSLSLPLSFKSDIGRILQLTFNCQSSIAWCFPVSGCWMLDTGCWMLDTGCWMLDAGYWILDTGYWMLDAGCWMLDAGYWMLDTGCWMLDAGYWILDTGHSLLVTCYYLLVAGC